MIIGLCLLIWGIGIVFFGLELQTNLQESTDPEWVNGRELYEKAPITFSFMIAIALAIWPLILLHAIFRKVYKHGN